jgi:hypothetical protein
VVIPLGPGRWIFYVSPLYDKAEVAAHLASYTSEGVADAPAPTLTEE